MLYDSTYTEEEKALYDILNGLRPDTIVETQCPRVTGKRGQIIPVVKSALTGHVKDLEALRHRFVENTLKLFKEKKKGTYRVLVFRKEPNLSNCVDESSRVMLMTRLAVIDNGKSAHISEGVKEGI